MNGSMDRTFLAMGHEWTGETWFEEKPAPESREHLKRPADPLVPRARITQKAKIDPEQMIPLSQAPMAKPEQPVSGNLFYEDPRD